MPIPHLGCLISESPSNLRHRETLHLGSLAGQAVPSGATLQPYSSVYPTAELAWAVGLCPPQTAPVVVVQQEGTEELSVRLWGRLDPTLGGLFIILLCRAAPPMVYTTKVHSSVPCFFSPRPQNAPTTLILTIFLLRQDMAPQIL